MIKRSVLLILLTILTGCGQFKGSDFNRPAISTAPIGPENPRQITIQPDAPVAPPANGPTTPVTPPDVAAPAEPAPLPAPVPAPSTKPAENNVPQELIKIPDFTEVVKTKSATSLILGYLSVSNTKISFTSATKKINAKGTLTLQDDKHNKIWEHPFELEGTIGKNGFADIMFPTGGSSADFSKNLRGRGMCFDEGTNPCIHAVVEVIYRTNETRADAIQIETNENIGTAPAQPPAAQNPPPSTNQEADNDGEGDLDGGLKPDLYIGDLYQDWRPLYEKDADVNPIDNQPPEDTADTDTDTDKAVIPPTIPPGDSQPTLTPSKPEEPTKTTPPVTKPPEKPAAPSTPVLPPTPVKPAPPATPAQPPAPTKPATPATPPTTDARPWDQAINGPYTVVAKNAAGKSITLNGALSNATSFITENNKSPADIKANVYGESDGNVYGTWELIQLLRGMGAYGHTINVPVYVGEIARKSGGVLPPHASHQNGLDADLGFPFVDAPKYGGTPSVLSASGKSLAPGFKIKETYDLLKYAYSEGKGAVNMYFVHPLVKAALCAEAEKRGELNADKKTGSGALFLSRIRPEVTHFKHFHIRIRCSQYQRKCRTLSEPPPASGC